MTNARPVLVEGILIGRGVRHAGGIGHTMEGGVRLAVVEGGGAWREHSAGSAMAKVSIKDPIKPDILSSVISVMVSERLKCSIL